MKTTIKHGPESCRSDAPTFTIETIDDYELAKRRIKDGSSYRESVALKDAIRIWEMEHASATESEQRA